MTWDSYLGHEHVSQQGLPTNGITYINVNGPVVVRDSKVHEFHADQPVLYRA